MLNRIMLISAVVISAISAAAALLGKGILFPILILLIIGLILCIIFRRFHFARAFIIVLPVAMLFLIPEYNILSKIEDTETLIGKTEIISGYICEEPEYSDNYTKYVVKTTAVGKNNLPQELKLFIVDFSGSRLDIFDKFKASVTFSRNDEKYRLSNYAEGLFISAQAENISPLGTKHASLYSYAVDLRRSIRNSVYNSLPTEEASVVCGIMLGDKNEIEESLYNDFKACGLVHIVCVSGLHLSVICYSLLRFLKALKFSQNLSCIITSAVVVLLMAVTGFSPSVMRASAMFLLMLLGRMLRKQSDILNLLGCSVVINCFINPLIVFYVGFQLSVLSVMGINVVVPWIERRLPSFLKAKNIFSRFGRYAAICASQCLAATIFTLPSICYSIKNLSAIAPIVSVFLIYPATLILIFCILAAIFSLISLPFLAKPLFLLGGILVKFFICIVRFFANSPVTTIRVFGSEVLFCILCCGLAAAICFMRYPNRRTVKLTICCITLIATLNLLVNSLLSLNRIKVNILSLESGKPAVLISQNGSSVAICSDMTKDEISSFKDIVSSCADSIDMLVINDYDKDMRRETLELCEHFNVYSIATNNAALSQAYTDSQSSIKVYDLSNSKIDIWDSLVIEFNTSEGYSSIQINSRDASFVLIYPQSRNYELNDIWAGTNLTVLSSPYPSAYPEKSIPNSAILLSESNINESTYNYFKESDSVTAISSGDVVSFTLNKNLSLK